MDTHQLVRSAVNGDKAALEKVITNIQDQVYYLALRMLAHPEDAKDATQDILIKIMTHLSSFKFESRFNTWVYRLAANYLISENKIQEKYQHLTFDIFTEDLESDLQEPDELRQNPDYFVLINEVRISCTMAMLLCLNPTHRMAYILGDILEMEHGEASDVLANQKIVIESSSHEHALKSLASHQKVVV